MDRYLLRYFLAVAELGHFSRAAVQVNVTQPTLSAGIAKLETQLGARLFDRSNRRVSLTPAGSRFLPRAKRIMLEYQLALEDASVAPHVVPLRVGVLSTIPTPILEGVVARHREVGAAETLEIIDASERDLANRLDRGRIDAALTILRPGGDRFEQESLRRERYLLATSSDHPAAEARSVRAEDLAGERMIVRQHCEALAETTRHFTERGVRPPVFAFKTTSDDKALAMVRSGLGVTVMPESFAGAGVRMTRVAGFDVQRELGLIFSDSLPAERRSSSPFLSLVRERLSARAPR